MATSDHLPTSGARTQATFREVNNRIRELASEEPVQPLFATEGDRADFLCECADLGCTEPIALPLDVFDQVRMDATHFVVSPDHVLPEIEQLVGGDESYAIVEKFGEAGAIAGGRVSGGAER